MDLVAGAVGSVVSKLGELLQAEYKLQKGLPERIEYLKNELQSAHTALRKVGETPPEHLDPQVRLWACEVREASYDMEDILDAFLVEVVEEAAPSENKDGLVKRLKKKMDKLFKKSKARHDIASAIEGMKKRLQEVSDRRDRYSVPVALPAPATTLDPRLVDMHKEAAQIIGIERTTAELKAMLQSSSHVHGDADLSGSNSNKTKIVSVVGAGGLGKTTLAKAVYDELSPGYDCRAFVSVGRKPKPVQIFTSIFFRLDKKLYQDIHNVEDLHVLIEELQKLLENKRYFIVIDDIWEPEIWKTIKSALVKKNCGSKIIITTRKFEVAKEADEVYNLQPLSHHNSRKLFYTRLFGGEDKCPSDHPDELSDTILKKCGGVPLAIITMASFLLGKSPKEWIEVCNSSGFCQHKTDYHMQNTMDILSLSYYDLPSHLKTCLLYLSVFPEDYLIRKDSLIWKWIAEGFVEKKEGRGSFEVGEEYFHDLINRSLIQGVDYGVYGLMDCRVHDMVLDLIVSKSKEENFVSIVSKSKEEADGPLSQCQARRLAPQNIKLDLTQKNDVNLPQLRSFIVLQCKIAKWTLHPWLKLICVLALERCTFVEGCHSLEHIGNLLHLRYLGIEGLRCKKLPEGVGGLKFLQTLDLKDTEIKELPDCIGELTQLVCLRAKQIKVPDGVIERLTSLEELRIGGPRDTDESEMQFVKDLGKLCELRVLDINVHTTRKRGVGTQPDLMHSLGSLQKMQHLTLNYSFRIVNTNAIPSPDLRCLCLPYIRFAKLPPWMNSAHLPTLSRLQIHVDDLDEQGVKALGGLPDLYNLSLGTCSTVKITSGCFQKLRSLWLYYSMVQFVPNEDSSVVMPKLEELEFTVDVKELMQNRVISSCKYLGLEYLPSIDSVSVELECSGAFVHDVAREEAELRSAINLHPNEPTLHIECHGKEKMKRSIRKFRTRR